MKKILFLALIFLLIIPSFNVCAEEKEPPYENYVYSELDKSVIKTRQAYVPSDVFFGTEWDCGRMSSPTDFDTDTNGNIYILDYGNNRIIVLDNNFNYQNIFRLDISDGENTITLNSPEGITVTDKYIYICDTNNCRIIMLNKKDGSFEKIVNAPKSSLLDNNFIFHPIKLSADVKGNLYVVSKGTYEGIINMRDNSQFLGFFSSNNVSSSSWDLFWRRFSTSKQRKSMEQLIPQDFSSICLDKDGFFLISTYTAVDGSMVKKVNQGGINVARLMSNVPVTGDVKKIEDGSMSGVSSFSDITSCMNKTYACLDKTRGRIFCYDNDGYLLYSFGTLSSQYGGFLSPTAVCYLGNEKIGVLDSINGNLTVFKPTEFGKAINKGIYYYNDLDYDNAFTEWNKVLTMSGNYPRAEDMVGKYYFNKGDYKKAITCFKDTNNKKMYSESKEALRSDFTYKNASVILLIVLIIILGIIALVITYKIKKKKITKR